MRDVKGVSQTTRDVFSKYGYKAPGQAQASAAPGDYGYTAPVAGQTVPLATGETYTSQAGDRPIIKAGKTVGYLGADGTRH